MDGCSDKFLADRFEQDGLAMPILDLWLRKLSCSAGKTAFGGVQSDANGATVGKKVVRSFHSILVVLATRDRVLSNATIPECIEFRTSRWQRCTCVDLGGSEQSKVIQTVQRLEKKWFGVFTQFLLFWKHETESCRMQPSPSASSFTLRAGSAAHVSTSVVLSSQK